MRSDCSCGSRRPPPRPRPNTPSIASSLSIGARRRSCGSTSSATRADDAALPHRHEGLRHGLHQGKLHFASLEVDDRGQELICGLPYNDPDLPDVSLSPAMTVYEPWNDSVDAVELVED